MAIEPIPIVTLTPEEKLDLLKDLQEAYYSGVSRVRFRERDVTYRSLEEMKKVIDDLTTSITGRRRRPAVFTTFGRGY